MIIRFVAALMFLLLPLSALAGSSYFIDRVAEGIYAAVVRPDGKVTSNAFFVEGDEYVVVGGAHLTRQAIADLESAVKAITDKPVRYYILSHHHRGFSHIDFDFPPGREVIMSWQTWQGVNQEFRAVPYPVLFYSDGITLKLGGRTVVLTNVEKGHTEGDTLVYLPESKVLFTSDLVYADSVGYMGEGHMQEWVLALELMERLDPEKIIPGNGPVSGPRAIGEYKNFLRDFLTEILQHIEQGESLEDTLLLFSLPQHQARPGYEKFFKTNVTRAYGDLKKAMAK